MSTRKPTRSSRPGLPTTSESPETSKSTKPRPTRSANPGAQLQLEQESADSFVPAAKRRRVSPTPSEEEEEEEQNEPRGRRRNSLRQSKRHSPDEEDGEEDEEETPRALRRSSRRDSNPDDGIGGSFDNIKPIKSPFKIPAVPKATTTAATHQQITNLYGGRRKYKDRDDTPSTVASSSRREEESPTKKPAPGSVRKTRGTPGSSKKVTKAAVPVVVIDDTDEGDVVEPETPSRRGRGRARGRRNGDDGGGGTDLEGDVIMGDSDAPSSAAPPSTTKKASARKTATTATRKADTSLSPVKGGLLRVTRRGRPPASGGSPIRGGGGLGMSPARKAASDKDDESSIYDFPGSDDEDPFKGKGGVKNTPKAKGGVKKGVTPVSAAKVNGTGKTPSKLTARMQRAAKEEPVEVVESSGMGDEGGDEHEEEAEEEEDEIEVVKEAATPKQPVKRVQTTKFSGKVSDEAVKYLKKTVMGKLTGRELPGKLVGLTDEYNTVLQLLEQTVVAGEGNSILLIGPRGSGKGLVVEKAIRALKREHDGDFIVVRLSGCLQTDERTAVREIWRQLGSAVEMDETKPINFADTLTTILALLSHPSEHDPNAAASMNETTSISVLFILSEFEQFAAHPRQTLLYNLFDIAQARKAPIAVVGLTSKINIVEDLEKRVKSRFSHRALGFRIAGSVGGKLEGWWEIAKAGLSVDVDELPGDVGKAELAYFRQWNASLDDAFKYDKIFRRTVEGVYSTSKSIQVLYSHLMMSICELSASTPFLGAGEALLKNALVAPDNKLYLLEDLPDLSLALLIAAARLDPILETDTCNFTMAYDEYRTLVSKVKIQSQTSWGMKLWDKDVALAAWERLAEWELIVPVVGGGAVGAGLLVGTGTSGVGRRESRMFRVDVGLLEIKRAGRAWGMGSVLVGWCSIG